MDRTQFELEICSNSLQSTISAEQGGADRVELCDNLYEGGTTPSLATIIQCKERTEIDVFPIIRPRGGDFLYSDLEFEVMKQDIALARQYGADGVVIGCLTPQADVDYEMCARLIEQAKGLPVTFHRAFDMTQDPFRSLELIKKLGVSRLLTSGQANQAIDGVDVLSELVKQSGNELKIMVGSGVSEDNIQQLVKTTGARAFHASLRSEQESKMAYRKADIFMGGLPQIPEYQNKFTNPQRVKSIIEQIKNI